MENKKNPKLPLSITRAVQRSLHLPYSSKDAFPFSFDLIDANIRPIEFGTNSSELSWLNQIHKSDRGCSTSFHSLEEMARKVLESETAFDLTNYRIVPSVRGFKGAFVSLASQLVSSKRPLILYASPNWIFDKIVSHVPGSEGRSFFAPSADDFLNKINDFSSKDKVAAVVCVDPSNPLGYRFSPEHIRSLEELSLRTGMVPIFDDVFRGLQKRGERHSASEYSHNSIVIETTSKRYTSRGLGVTWSLIPRSLSASLTSRSEKECEGCNSFAALVIDSLHSTDHSSQVRAKLIEGKRAFIEGASNYLDYLDDPGTFHSAFEGMPLFTYTLPLEAQNLKAESLLAFHKDLGERIGVSSGYHWIMNQREKDGISYAREMAPALAYLRICPTKEPAYRLHEAGALLGKSVRSLLKNKK